MKVYALFFKGPDGYIHPIRSSEGGPIFIFTEESLHTVREYRGGWYPSKCGLYELEENKAYLVREKGFKEDFPARRMLSLNEQRDIAIEIISRK